MKWPKWLRKLFKGTATASSWIDDKIFSVPEGYYSRCEAQLKAEQDANQIRRVIRSCVSLRQTKQVEHMIENYRERHGNTVQVEAAAASLMLDLNKHYLKLLQGDYQWG